MQSFRFFGGGFVPAVLLRSQDRSGIFSGLSFRSCSGAYKKRKPGVEGLPCAGDYGVVTDRHFGGNIFDFGLGRINIFVVSTYDTDYILVKEDRTDKAAAALETGEWTVLEHEV
jgi:hypothetical protein